MSYKIQAASLIANKISNKLLQRCWKQRVSTTSQSLEYRKSLFSESSALFSPTVPTSRRQPHLCKALCAQNTFIDSHHAAHK